MAFWDRFKAKQELAPGESDGKLRAGKKHGVWRERAEKATTRWDGKDFIPVDHDLAEVTYVFGVKTGPYTIFWGSGGKREEGTYVEGKRDGMVRMWNREGELRGEGTFRNGELHGHYRALHWDSGTLDYEGDYVDGKRHGSWKMGYDSGGSKEQGAHADGEPDGEWIRWSNDGVEVERGRYERGKRVGRWTFSSAKGVIAEGAFAADQRVGAWTLRRDDGSLRASGEYRDGVPIGTWRFYAPSGAERAARECADAADLERWETLDGCVELLAEYDALAAGADTAPWIARVKAAFTELAQPWQVESKRDAFGQTSLSAPLDASWQLRVATGVPLQHVCRDACRSKLLEVLDEWPATTVAAAVVVAERVATHPSYAPREWLTRILEAESDDPRNRLVARFEPGRAFTPEMIERFRTRVPHLEELALRECYFEHGLVPLFERGYPQLQRLLIVRSETGEGELQALVALLAKATWLGRLEQLAIVESGDALGDGELAALLANEHMTALRLLTLDNAVFGPLTARALGTRTALESLDLRDSTLDVAALAAIAALPNLEELTLRRCSLPAMTSRQAAAIGPSAKLRAVELAGTLGADRHDNDTTGRTPYAVARRLAVIPALASVEDLDVSDNELDYLAARVLARSPHLGRLKTLDWTGNDDADHDLAELRAALPNATIATSTRRGNVVVLQL